MDETIHGFNASLIVQEDGLTIKPGVVGDIFGGGSYLSEKFIPYSNVSGIEFKKGFPFIGEGYIKINTFGEDKESKDEALKQNIVRFNAMQNKDFERVVNNIKERISSK